MSYPVTVEAESNEFLLDGKHLSKAVLIDRLAKMNIELDHCKVENKQYFVDLYNRIIQQFDRRMMIKSILNADIIDRPQKNLKKKRERDNSGDSELNPNNTIVLEEPEKNYRFKIENINQIEEREKISGEQEDAALTNQNALSSKNLDLDSFMNKIHADLHSYQKKMRNNFEGALNEIKKAQSDKEQPRVIYLQDNFNIPQGEVRVQSKKPSQRNSRTNLRSVEASTKNIPVFYNDNKLEISGNSRSQIYLNENQKEDVERYIADSSASDSEINVECNPIKQPYALRRNGIFFESSTSFPKIESRNSRKSLPGSSKNIQEILNKIEIKLSQPMSPRIINDSNKSKKSFVFKSFRGEAQNPVLSQRGNSNSRLNSSRQLVINVRENPSNVTEFSAAKEGDSCTRKHSSTICISSFPIEGKIFNSKAFSYYVFYSVIAAGFILISYFILKNATFSQIDCKHKVFIGLVAFGLVGLLVVKKINSKRFFRKTAEEDYNMIKNIIQNLYSCEENPIGLFENNILRDFSMKHQMSEATYTKSIFPLLKNLRDSEDTIVEGEVIIQEQAQNIWKLK